MLCRILQGQVVAWPALDPGFASRIVALAIEQGVAPLVHCRMRDTDGWLDWPAAVREALAHEYRMQAALDLLREAELTAVLHALADARIGSLLFKGAALAYSHYSDPALRPRCDTDLLIDESERERTGRLLASRGYTRPNAVSGRLVSFEDNYVKRERTHDHVLDVHWRINGAQAFAQALSHSELRSRSIVLPELGDSARAFGAPDALLLACMHRAASLDPQSGDGNRLIWLYDIHLLASRMSGEAWRVFGDLCAKKAMRRITSDAFACTQDAFGTEFPADVLARLSEPGAREVSAGYLHASRTGVMLNDLRALRTWCERALLIREWIFPPTTYMLVKYHSSRRWLLPWLHLRRLAQAALRVTRP